MFDCAVLLKDYHTSRGSYHSRIAVVAAVEVLALVVMDIECTK